MRYDRSVRWLLTFCVVSACGHPPAPAPAPTATVPRLLPPPPIDPTVRGATYLTAVALQLAPGWSQFLDDCRLRLSPHHPLNQLKLAAMAELTVDRKGNVVATQLATSGSPDFDRAV